MCMRKKHRSARFERAFARDFSDVKIHEDDSPAQLNTNACVQDRNIFVQRGRKSPCAPRAADSASADGHARDDSAAASSYCAGIDA